MRIIFSLLLILTSQICFADCVSEAIAQLKIDTFSNQVRSIPLPADGSGNIRVQLEIFGTQSGGAVLLCNSESNTFVSFETPYQPL